MTRFVEGEGHQVMIITQGLDGETDEWPLATWRWILTSQPSSLWISEIGLVLTAPRLYPEGALVEALGKLPDLASVEGA